MSPFKKISRFLCRPKTSTYLLTLIIVSCFAGLIIPQTTIHPASYFLTLSESFPLLVTVIEKFSLNSLFSSYLFLGLTICVFLALTLTLRLQGKKFFCRIRDLRKKGRPNRFTFVASLSTLTTCGPLLLHLGLMCLIVAALYGYLFHSRGFIQVMEGESVAGNADDWLESERGILAPPLKLDFTFRLETMEDRYWPDDSLKQLISSLTIRKNGSLQRMSTSPARPIHIGKTTITQSSHYGYAVTFILKVPSQPGIPVHYLLDSTDNPRRPAKTSQDFPLTDYLFEITLYPDPHNYSYTLNNPVVELKVTNSAGDHLFEGRMRAGERIALAGNDLYCYEIKQWSGLTLMQGYAQGAIYLAFGLILIGVLLTYITIKEQTGITP